MAIYSWCSHHLLVVTALAELWTEIWIEYNHIHTSIICNALYYKLNAHFQPNQIHIRSFKYHYADYTNNNECDEFNQSQMVRGRVCLDRVCILYNGVKAVQRRRWGEYYACLRAINMPIASRRLQLLFIFCCHCCCCCSSFGCWRALYTFQSNQIKCIALLES